MSCKKFLIRIHNFSSRKILAISDPDTLEKISNIEFYMGEEVDMGKLLRILKSDSFSSINALGKNSVEILVKYFKIDKKNIKFYNGIPHLILVFL